jgi:hypothetical protein
LLTHQEKENDHDQRPNNPVGNDLNRRHRVEEYKIEGEEPPE